MGSLKIYKISTLILAVILIGSIAIHQVNLNRAEKNNQIMIELMRDNLPNMGDKDFRAKINEASDLMQKNKQIKYDLFSAVYLTFSDPVNDNEGSPDDMCQQLSEDIEFFIRRGQEAIANGNGREFLRNVNMATLLMDLYGLYCGGGAAK